MSPTPLEKVEQDSTNVQPIFKAGMCELFKSVLTKAPVSTYAEDKLLKSKHFKHKFYLPASEFL